MHVDEVVEVGGRFGRGLALEKVWWRGREYEIKKLGYHHTFRRGRTLIHVYSVASDNLFFRLEMDSENLTFRVMETEDDV
mgnify:FL=1